MTDRWATFDCYGTLIDWMGGIRATLADLWPAARRRALLARYHEIEPEVQEGRGDPVPQVMAEALAKLAADEGLELADEIDGALGDSLPSWPPFAEVPEALGALRERGWRLAILSNTDPDFLDASLEAIGVPVDERIVAPRSARTSRRSGIGRRSSSGRAPTGGGTCTWPRRSSTTSQPCAELGLPCVWINRQAETSDLPRAGELADLVALPETLEDLVPAGDG